MRYDLKIDEPYLKAKLAGDKLFEIRFNDRGYQKGDIVTYKEYEGSNDVIYHTFEIIYVTGFMQEKNHVVFGEKHLSSEKLI